MLADIKNCFSLLANKGFANITNMTLAKKERNKTIITWSTGFNSLYSLKEKPFASIDEYRYYLRNNMLNAILFDGSLVQVSYVFENDELVWHRLCFYPCPFELDPDLLRELPYDDVVDIYATELDEFRLRSPIRFDYEPKNAKDGHSSTHVHLNVEDCRCPVVAPIGIWDFISFITFNFYNSVWDEICCEGNDEDRILYDPTIAPDERQMIHFSLS